MGVLRFTGAKRDAFTLVNVTKLGEALPEQVHCGADENDNNNYTCHNCDDDGNCFA